MKRFSRKFSSFPHNRTGSSVNFSWVSSIPSEIVNVITFRQSSHPINYSPTTFSRLSAAWTTEETGRAEVRFIASQNLSPVSILQYNSVWRHERLFKQPKISERKIHFQHIPPLKMFERFIPPLLVLVVAYFYRQIMCDVLRAMKWKSISTWPLSSFTDLNMHCLMLYCGDIKLCSKIWIWSCLKFD